MAQEPVNYEAVLVDLRARRAQIDAAIAAIEQLQNVLAGQPGGGGGDGGPSTRAIDLSDIEDDAFFGLSIVEAAKKYLGMVKRKQGVKEIAEALDRGGLPHTSTDFVNTVGTMLRRANDPDLAKVGRGDWGLASWYGNRRPKQEPAKKAKKGKRRKPTFAKIPVADSGETLMEATAAVLRGYGEGLQVDELLVRVRERTGRDVARATLVGMLAEKVRKGDTFTRPQPSVYALVA
jgi:hypothetical protein